MMLAGVLALTATAPAWTQVIPNPLVRPQRSSSADQPAAPGAQTRGATAAPSGRAARGADGEGLPDEDASEKSPSERLANLYVSAVIGDRAVLRSLEVSTVPPLNSNVSSAGGGSSGGSSGSSGGGAGGFGGNVAGLRSQAYSVRNGEVLPFLDKLRLLVRVRDTTVTLYDVTDVPAGNYDPLDLMDRGFPVAFRGSVDSVQSAPFVPPTLIAPGSGLDGAAFGKARDTNVRNSSSTSSGSRSSSDSSSSNPVNDNNP